MESKIYRQGVVHWGKTMKERRSFKDTSCEGAIGRLVSRRDFIRAAAIGTAGMALAGSHVGCAGGQAIPRKGMGNLFMEGEKPLLVVVEGTDVGKMFEAGLDAIGGLQKLVSGKNVVLKPNILTTQPFPVTTDIEMVLGFTKHARTAGASSLTVCDACGGGVTKAEKFKALGYPPRLAEAGIGLDAADFSDRMVHVFVSKDSWRSHPTIGVVKTIQEADVVVNIPVIKRHDGARFTCALKNHFGSVYLPLRQLAHSTMRSGGEGKDFFDRALAEYADSVRPELNIVDGRQLLVRGGPSLRGKAEIKSGVNKMVFCGDMVATDIYCSQLMEEHDDTYSTDMISVQLETAQELGLGVGDLKNVAIKEIIV